MFGINAVYIYFRQEKLFPKYAELVDDGNAFNPEMSNAADEEAQSQNQAQTATFPSYGAYEGQEDYRPGGQYSPPRQQQRPGATYNTSPHNSPPRYNGYGPQAQQPYGHTPVYHQPPAPYAGQAAYGAQVSAPDATAYAGRTAYSRQHSPLPARTSPTPYPRESMIG